MKSGEMINKFNEIYEYVTAQKNTKDAYDVYTDVMVMFKETLNRTKSDKIVGVSYDTDREIISITYQDGTIPSRLDAQILLGDGEKRSE